MCATKIDNRRDLLLLLLFSPGARTDVNEPIVGRTRLVKMLFLFKAEVLTHFHKGTSIAPEEFYSFFPWDFGPFSTDVYDDLTFFILRGFVESSDTETEPLPESAQEWEQWLQNAEVDEATDSFGEYHEESFRLSDKGADFASHLYESLSQSQKEVLRTFKARTSRAPLRALLRYIYETYPDMTTRSRIRSEVVGTP